MPFIFFVREEEGDDDELGMISDEHERVSS